MLPEGTLLAAPATFCTADRPSISLRAGLPGACMLETHRRQNCPPFGTYPGKGNPVSQYDVACFQVSSH
jgi:hypothetical protein